MQTDLTFEPTIAQSTMFWQRQERKVKTMRVELRLDAQSFCLGFPSYYVPQLPALTKLICPPVACTKTSYVYNIIETVNSM